MIQPIVVSGLVLAALALGAFFVARNWEKEKRTTYEEYLAPVIENHGLKFISSRPPVIAVYPKRTTIRLGGVDIDYLLGKRWASRIVIMEDSRGRDFESRARLHFDRSGLTEIEWHPDISDLQGRPRPPHSRLGSTMNAHGFIDPSRIIGSLILLSALLPAGLGIWVYTTNTKFLSNAKSTDGTVIEVQPSRSGDGTTYHTVFEFQDDTGTKHRKVSSWSSNPPRHAVGLIATDGEAIPGAMPARDFITPRAIAINGQQSVLIANSKNVDEDLWLFNSANESWQFVGDRRSFASQEGSPVIEAWGPLLSESGRIAMWALLGNDGVFRPDSEDLSAMLSVSADGLLETLVQEGQ